MPNANTVYKIVFNEKLSENINKIMSETLACRLCLATNTKLLNMFKYRLHIAYATLTGIQMDSSDGLPAYACSICSVLLVKSVAFKWTCHRSQDVLKFAHSQRLLSTKYVENLKTTAPISLSIQKQEPIGYIEHQIVKEETDWDFTDDYKLKESESSDEEPLSSKVTKKPDVPADISVKNGDDYTDLPEAFDDDDFPNGEVDEMVLTKEEQIEEVQSRKTSMNYLNSFYKCDHCYKGFITDATYKNHMARHDPSSGDHECEICHIFLEHKRALRAHIMTSHERKFVCKLCNHISKSRHRAKEHSKWHSGHKYVCKYCGASFTKSTSHLTHIRLHHPSKHTCFVCGESFIGKIGLNMHHKKAHRNIKNTGPDAELQCASCKVQFHSIEALTRHASGTEGCDLSLRPCAKCGESWSTEEQLREHLKEHSKEDPVKCDECNRTFAHSRSYSVHYQRVHMCVRANIHKRANAPVVCEICGRNFITKASLRYHQRTHTGERPYQCTECPKRFTVAQRLQIHQRTHTGERPYKCGACPKAFKHKAALNRHDRVHTGAKPYACPHCGKSFSQSNSMKVHVRTVHLKLPSPYRTRRAGLE